MMIVFLFILISIVNTQFAIAPLQRRIKALEDIHKGHPDLK